MKSDQRQRLILNLVGIAGVAFFAIYLIRRIQDGQVASALWACHLASLLTGTGILLRRPTFIGIGVLWLVVGIPLWCVYLAIGGAFRPASLLTHVGGLAVGVLGLKAIGMRSNLWWKAILVLLVLLCHLTMADASGVERQSGLSLLSRTQRFRIRPSCLVVGRSHAHRIFDVSSCRGRIKEVVSTEIPIRKS
ncbi:MAG: hypothetical protein R3B91_08580 [Planctomycetaceae bacterium]